MSRSQRAAASYSQRRQPEPRAATLEQEDAYLLIARYLARQTSSDENAQLATWVAQSPENERTFEQLKTVWQASQTSAAPAETAAALGRLKARLA